MSTMLQFRLYGGSALPSGLSGFMKAGANIGSVVGQFGFGAFAYHRVPLFEVSEQSGPCSTGYCADRFGRKAICKSFARYALWKVVNQQIN